MSPEPEHKNETLPRIIAWSVHAFTALGVVPALLSIQALWQGDARTSLLWLGVALIIDGLDGPLARRFEVTRHTPRFDGATLDMVIDYLTYTVIPALMIWHLGFVPQGWELAAASYIMLTALYCFGNRDMKTPDNYFRGFPATWNVVVLYFFLLGTDPWTNLISIAILGALTFIPLKFVHPLRVQRLKGMTLAMTLIWGLSSTWLVITADEQPLLETEPFAFGAWLLATAYFAGISLVRSIKNRRHTP